MYDCKILVSVACNVAHNYVVRGWCVVKIDFFFFTFECVFLIITYKFLLNSDTIFENEMRAKKGVSSLLTKIILGFFLID